MPSLLLGHDLICLASKKKVLLPPLFIDSVFVCIVVLSMSFWSLKMLDMKIARIAGSLMWRWLLSMFAVSAIMSPIFMLFTSELEYQAFANSASGQFLKTMQAGLILYLSFVFSLTWLGKARKKQKEAMVREMDISHDPFDE